MGIIQMLGKLLEEGKKNSKMYIFNFFLVIYPAVTKIISWQNFDFQNEGHGQGKGQGVKVEHKMLGHLLQQKVCIRDTSNLSTDADRSTNTFFLEFFFKQILSGTILVFKALQVGPQMHQFTSQTPPMRGTAPRF